VNDDLMNDSERITKKKRGGKAGVKSGSGLFMR
jgi:hypothetical protein